MTEGETISYYKVIRQLEKGGMGEVYLAIELALIPVDQDRGAGE